MSQEPHLLHHLLVSIDDVVDPVTVRVLLRTPVARGLGIWPETLQAVIPKPEFDKLPSDLSTVVSVLVRLGAGFGGPPFSVDVDDWLLVDVDEADWGADINAPYVPVTPRVWTLTLEDGRSRLNGDRGGCLFDGLLNPVDPAGQIVGTLVRCSDLVTKCIQAMGCMTYREGVPLSAGLIESLDAFDPPTELSWRGAHAPTELQRILEWTRHGFAYNQDGTYSVVKLVDPPTAPTAPDVGVAALPSASIALKPNTSSKCIITSAPTRNLIERYRTLFPLTIPAVPLQWVGVDTDGSIAPLTSLSWWPAGKTVLEVFKNEYAAVAEDKRTLAQSSIYRMIRLHDTDLAEGWTLVSRLLDAVGDDPAKFMLMSKAAHQNNLGMWVNSDTLTIESAHFDLRTGVFTAQRPLVRVSSRTAALHASAVALANDQLQAIFCHHPNAGDDTDYFNAVYYVDGAGDVVEDTSGGALQAALDEGAPVYRFEDLQVHYRETPGTPGPVTEVNLDDIKTLAQAYATSLITAGNATIEVKEFPGMFNADPDGSVTRIVWDARTAGEQGWLRTVMHLGRHAQITSDYLQRTIGSRTARGGSIGSARGSAGVGAARGNLAPAGGGFNGASSGARDGATHATAPSPMVRRTRLEPFDAKITSQTAAGANNWAYGFTEVYKSNTGFGAAQWTTVSGGVSGSAGNRFELINDGSGANYLGIGITNNELNDTANSGACAMDLRPVPVGMIVQMWPEIVRKADGTVAIEYLFTWANGVYEEP